VSRLPTRLRLSLAFAVAMALLLAALGTFLYLQVRSSLDEQLDASLRAEAASVPAAGFGGRRALVEEEKSIAQVLGPRGTVLTASPARLRRPLASPAARAHFVGERKIPDAQNSPYRLFVAPDGTGRTIVVGASLEERNESLQNLLIALLVGGPIALLLSTLAGYTLAGAVLRPVEHMRRRAEEISTETAGERLPLPRARDEIRRLGETLNAVLGRLEAGLERERRFVADASHELRTPLALLRTELELAQRQPRTADELRLALDSAAEEVERLSQLAEDLLVLARADQGKLALRREPVVLGELLDAVAARFARRASDRHRQLAVAAARPFTANLDRLRLEQALGNLVDNALRHGAGTVTLDARSENGTVAVSVGDEGAGFPASLVPTAFDRFTRGDDARARGGAGLGLALVDAVARAHDGSARIEGARVTIALPRGAESPGSNDDGVRRPVDTPVSTTPQEET
jgi:two-component system, OmpR family, sensor kinase